MKRNKEYKTLLKGIAKWFFVLAVILCFFWIKYDVTPLQFPSFVLNKTKAFGVWIDTEIGNFIGSTKKLKNNIDNERNRAEKLYKGEAYLEVPEPTIK